MSGGTNGGQTTEDPAIAPIAAYLGRVEIKNVRSISSLLWEVEPVPGWNVVLGDNGSGKSTFLRVIAYLMIPALHRSSLWVNLSDWVRSGQASGSGRVRAKALGQDWLRVESDFIAPRVGPGAPINSGTLLTQAGWFDRYFCAAFGPFRRFAGGDAEYEKQFAAIPTVARQLSLFDERVSLTESLSWLKKLRFKELEQDDASASLLASLRRFVNQPGFLPNGASLGRITSDKVYFTDGNGAEVAIEELSDGYRSILSLIFELIRQIAAHFGAEHVFGPTSTTVIAPGIVLIDEVDAHLHPKWQRGIGLFLRACFPAIQFIVTTHSPLVCQAAEVGTVFQLPRPGTSEEGRMVTGVELDRLLYGDLVEAYETEAMGGIGRSDRAKELLGRFAELNRREIDKGLSEEERKEQRRLRGIFSESPETRP
jgi:energy-coupling factor transporter ATP-binding protein EcfA2